MKLKHEAQAISNSLCKWSRERGTVNYHIHPLKSGTQIAILCLQKRGGVPYPWKKLARLQHIFVNEIKQAPRNLGLHDFYVIGLGPGDFDGFHQFIEAVYQGPALGRR